MIRFYGYFRISEAYRSRIAFNLKGLSYDFVPVHLRRDGGEQKQVAYRALNPQAPVPALEVDGLTACGQLLEREDASGPFAFERPGLADTSLVPQLFSADRFGVDLAAMPRLRAVRQACEALPAFASAHPSLRPNSED